MKTDSIFYRIMQTAPGILFELLGESAELAREYEFRSVEIKQLAFRLDGIFWPKPDAYNQTIMFVEVQFQDDPRFYQRFFGEIFLFLAQHPDTVNWRAVVLFSDRKIEPEQTLVYDVLINSPKVQRIYLEDFGQDETESLGIGLMQLIVAKPRSIPTIIEKAQALILRTQREPRPEIENQAIIELIETIMVYKFPKMSREEIEAMFGLSELKQTKVYQEALLEGRQEGRQEGELAIIFRLLARRVGTISPKTEAKIRALSLIQLEELSEALLDFSQQSDLSAWLKSHS